MAEQVSSDEPPTEEQELDKETEVKDDSLPHTLNIENHAVKQPFLASTHLPIRVRTFYLKTEKYDYKNISKIKLTSELTITFQSETDLISNISASSMMPLENHPLIYSNPEFTTVRFLTPQASVQTVNAGAASVAPSEASVNAENSRKPS